MDVELKIDFSIIVLMYNKLVNILTDAQYFKSGSDDPDFDELMDKFEMDYNVDLLKQFSYARYNGINPKFMDEIQYITNIVEHRSSIYVISDSNDMIELYFSIHGFGFIEYWRIYIKNIEQYITYERIISEIDKRNQNGIASSCIDYMYERTCATLKYSKRIVEHGLHTPLIKEVYDDVVGQCHISLHFALGF